MKNIFINILMTLVLFSLQSCSESWEQSWEIDGLANPESVAYDSVRDVVYVSNQNSGGRRGKASIGKLSLDGKIINKEWVKGFNEPKGIAIRGNSLFVSDVKTLIEIDIPSSKIIKAFIADGANFLNDVVVGTDGEIFVSDMFNSSIYKLDNTGSFKLWLETPEIENPNGLLIVRDKLLIAAWGSFDNKKPLTAQKGNFIQVTLKTKKIRKLTKNALGNLDGIQKYKYGRYFISDWATGDIYLSDDNYNFKKIIKLEQSAGDIAYIPEKNILLIPMAKQGKVLAYEIQ